MNKFKANRHYLLLYCLLSLFLFIAIDYAIFSVRGINFNFQLNSNDFWLILLPVFLCGLPSSIMHNCAHNNIKPKLLNLAVGELCGTFMLYGFRGFALAHMFHHIHPDDPLMDPHPPQGQTFLRFVISPIKSTLVVVERAYYKIYGKNSQTVINIKAQLLLFNLCLIARTLFWLLLLGPKYFVLAYLPVYFANIFVFAHINFAAHKERVDGSSEILNLNHNLYYQFINFVSFGGYFHKSHHLRPGVFNPARIKILEEKRYITNPKFQGIRV